MLCSPSANNIECCMGETWGVVDRLVQCGLPCSLQVGLARGMWAPPSVPGGSVWGKDEGCGQTGRTGQSPTPLPVPLCTCAPVQFCTCHIGVQGSC